MKSECNGGSLFKSEGRKFKVGVQNENKYKSWLEVPRSKVSVARQRKWKRMWG